MNEQDVKKALSEVQDPDLGKDLVSLNMIQDIEIKGNALTFSIHLTTPACPLKEKIKNDCLQAIHKNLDPDIQVTIHFTSSVTSIRNQQPLLKGVKNIIAISSGKGGVGKSTVATNMALALAESGAQVGLVDADIFGPSIPAMLNCEKERPGVKEIDGQKWMVPIEQQGIKLMSIGFLAQPNEAIVWRGPMASSALRQFFGNTLWAPLDYLLIDLPPGTSDIHLTLVQTLALTGAVVVTTPQKIALLDAQKSISMFKQDKINVPILGVIENMSYFSPPELPNHKYYIFGEKGGQKLAKQNEINFLGQIPILQEIREYADKGIVYTKQKNETLQAIYKDMAANLASKIAIRNANFEETKKVEITTT